METEKANFPVTLMCRVLEVSRSGYYAWHVREASARSQADEALKRQIQAIHERSRGTYGVPRVHAELEALGEGVSRKRVARLMGELGVQGVSRRRGTRTTSRDLRARPAPDLVERDFSADAPGPVMGCRHHVYPDLGRFFVPGGGG